jgi:hypothetical protein
VSQVLPVRRVLHSGICILISALSGISLSPVWLGEPFAPEQPLVPASHRPRDQRRHQTLHSPLPRPSYQPQDQSSHLPLPIAPEQRPLLARPLPPDQAPALSSPKPSPRPPPQPLHPLQNLGRFRSHDFRQTWVQLNGQLLRLLLPPTLSRVFPGILFLLTLLPESRICKTLQLGKAVGCKLSAHSQSPVQPPEFTIMNRAPWLVCRLVNLQSTICNLKCHVPPSANRQSSLGSRTAVSREL